MAVDLRHFRAFVVVAEEGNIGRAAQRLFITQPALSRQVQQLEREVGAPLLVRTARGVELTGAGRQLLEKARVALAAADDALAVARAGEPHGRLVVGLPVAGRREEWYGLVQAFADRHPRLEIEQHEALSGPLQRRVLAGELDLAVVLSPSRLPDLRYTRVLEDELSLWVHDDHPLAARAHVDLTDLDGVTLVLVGGPDGRASGFNAAVRALFEGTGAQPVFEETAEVFPPRAARGDPGFCGISVPLEYPPGVVAVPLVPRRTMPFEVVHRADMAARAAVAAFAPFAREHLAAARAGDPCAPGMAAS